MKSPLLLRPSATLAAFTLFALPAARATTYTWTGASGSGMNTPGNWSPATTPVSSTETAFLFGTSSQLAPQENIAPLFRLNALTFTNAAGAYTLGGLGAYEFVNTVGNTTPTLTQSSANAISISNNLTLTNTLTVGGDGAGVLTLSGAISGAGALNKAGSSTLTLTGTNTYTGGMIINGGTVAFSGGSLNSSGRITVNAGGVLAVNGTANVTLTGQGVVQVSGTDAAPGRLVLTGGTISDAGGSCGQEGPAIVEQSGGTYTAGPVFTYGLGNNYQGTYNLSGGTFNVPYLGVGFLSTGTFNQSGGSVTSTALSIGYAIAANGTYNLNGGTLVISYTSANSGTGVFNFNGGVLRAAAGGTNFFQGITTAQVRGGGANIDSNGYNVTVAQLLAHSGLDGDPALDGGLTKLGAGTLTLTGANTFTGGVTIKAGTVSVSGDGTSPSNPLGDAHGTVTLLGSGALVFTNGAVTTGRTYNLGLGTLAPASGGTLTYANGAAINGGALGTGTHVLDGSGIALNGTRTTNGTILNQTGGSATFSNATLSGNTTLTQTKGTLNTTGDLIATPLTTLSLAGQVNVAGAYLSGATTVQSGGRLNGTGGTAAPLYLDGSRGTTINSGGQLNATGSSTIELGGLLTNNGTQNGVLHVNLGGVVQGNGTFGTVTLAAASTFNAAGTITGSLVVASGATVTLNGSGNTLTVSGAFTNNGTLRFTSGARLSVTSGATNFVNNGIIDLLSGSASLPAGFTNNGVVLDSSLNRVKAVARAADGSRVTVQIDAYPGHTYKLQRSDSLASGSFTDVANVPAQGNAATNTAPVTLTFADPAPLAGKGFYRVQVDS